MRKMLLIALSAMTAASLTTSAIAGGIPDPAPIGATTVSVGGVLFWLLSSGVLVVIG